MMLILERMEIELGFHPEFVDLLMPCVTSMKYTVRFNGREMDCFIPCMGLRRGDPSPPYLFHICVEGLSSALTSREEVRGNEGIRRVQKCTTIFPLIICRCFLILMKAHMNYATSLR